MSHPAWVCGLKLTYCTSWTNYRKSHPAWVCGLKQFFPSALAYIIYRHTLRGCVDWNTRMDAFLARLWVTPCVGVWIETGQNCSVAFYQLVTPCVGVWIETFWRWVNSEKNSVTPCVGVWIETSFCSFGWLGFESHPAWVCGLKLSMVLEIMLNELSHPAWVCGLKRHSVVIWLSTKSHTLRGCVDWNRTKSPSRRLSDVTPCVGVWIETSTWPLTDRMLKRSHPAWVCGLKPL